MAVTTKKLPTQSTDKFPAYKDAIDSTLRVLDKIAGNFAPHEAATPAMTVVIDAGKIFNGVSLTLVAQQTTTVIAAPSVNPRIDRVVIDAVTGVYSIVTGAEAASPVAPAFTSGKYPVCQIALSVAQTTILNANITDERVGSGAGNSAFNKLNATTAPTVSNDNTQGYSEGSYWIDVTGNEAYRCVDSATGAAIWINTTIDVAEINSLVAAGILAKGISSTADATAIVIDILENVGMGVAALQTWVATATALQLGGVGSLIASKQVTAGGSLIMANNLYIDAAAATRYIITDFATTYIQKDGTHVFSVAASGTADAVATAIVALAISPTGSVIAGLQTALATTATDGFLYVPTCAGVPTGVPTTQGSSTPLVYDTTNKNLYFYAGAVWNLVGGGGGGSVETAITTTQASAYACDFNSGNVFEITMTGDVAITFSNPPTTGTVGKLRLVLKHSGSGRTPTLPASVVYDGGIPPSWSPDAGDEDVLDLFTYDGGTTYRAKLLGRNYSLVYSIVGVGAAGTGDTFMLGSNDAVNWTEITNPSNDGLYDIVHNGEIYVAIGFQDGVDAYIITSSDGITWTEQTNPASKSLYGVGWGMGLFVAVGDDDLTDAYLITSPDGITWTERTNAKAFTLRAVVFGEGLFVAVGQNDGTDAYIVTSPDGITWTERTNPKNFYLYNVTYGNGLFVAVGAGDGTDSYIVTSPDGITWTEQTNPKNIILYDVKYNGNLFCAVGANDGADAYVITSNDGVNWTERSSVAATSFYGLTYNGEQFIATGTKTATSQDGITWINRNTPAAALNNITSIQR